MATKRALCVGINYPGTESALAGCVNDATDWAELLRREGYVVGLLLDGGATGADIVGALSEMAAQSRWGDRVVFTFSGHGTWVPDRDGDEADGRDEALCPSDFTTNGVITDDQLQSVFGAASRGVGSLILSDSCHSGTVSRFAGVVPPDSGTRKFVPPESFTGISEERARLLEASTGVSAPRATTSLVSGCADSEYSYDAWFGDRPNGAFSRAAIDAYAPGLSLAAWYSRIRATLPSTRYQQTPQLTAANVYRKYARAL